MFRLLRVFSFLTACVLAPGVSGEEPYEIVTTSRVVAFGDVHGAFDDWVTMLTELEIIDKDLNWIGGDTHLVSLGDLIDRGPGSRAVVELMIRLDRQAEQAGGAVHMVLGNHEIMVMTGSLGYVSAEEFAAFAADESESERRALYAQFRQFNPDVEEAEARAQFDQLVPPGFIALRKAYSPDGKLGRWLLQQPFILKLNDKVYMHGGISGPLSGRSIEDLNTTLKEELTNYLAQIGSLRAAGILPWYITYSDQLDFLNVRAEEFIAANPEQRADWFDPFVEVFEAEKALLFNQRENPFWYRGTARCHPYAESFNTERFLNLAGAKQLVVGHTPLPARVSQRMEGLVLRLDSGMLTSVYGGLATALVSENGLDYIHYLGSDKREQPLVESRSLARSLSGMSDGELESFMREAPVVASEEIGTGITKPRKVTQELNGITNDAVFKYGDSHPGLESFARYIRRRHDDADRYVYDVAAYKLDRMIGLEMVPTAVLAQLDGQDGALSDWIDGAINERDRLEREIPFGGHCPQWEQYRLRFVFDILIHNEDRNLTNIMWTEKDFLLKFIDHSLAFRVVERRPRQYRKVDVEISDLLADKLESLTRENLTEELSPYLHPRQIDSILARRDLLLNERVRPAKVRPAETRSAETRSAQARSGE